jgi:septal ring factor EnvC (AmiA/AmiB activator)
MLNQSKKIFSPQLLPILVGFIMVLFLAFYPATLSPVPTVAVNYDQEKQDVEAQKAKINDSLSQISNNLEDTQQLGSTLKDEIDSKNAEIATTEQATKDVNNLLVTLDEQIAANQKDRDETVANIKAMFLELQKQQSPFQTLLSSENLADALSKFYGASVLQNKADEYRIKLEEANASLESNKADQIAAKAKLDQTKALLASQQSYLVDLKANTDNDENKYQQLKASLQSQNDQLNSQLTTIQKQQQAEAAAAAEAAAKQKAAQQQNNQNSDDSSSEGGGSIIGGPSYTCWFEETRPLNVPSGFFGIPAQGYLVRDFDSCNHDAADIANGTGTPLLAVANGTVERKGSFDIVGYGIYVVIKIVLPSGQTIYTLYAHMNSPSPLSVGQSVTKGQQVGSMGCTGDCSGTHVHFMIYSDTYAITGPGCRLGASKCYNPVKYINI